MAFGIVAPAAYLTLRLYERARGAVPSPELIIAEVHTQYYWRCLGAAWWGGLAAMVVAGLLVGRDDERLARTLKRVVVPFTALAIILSMLYP